MGRKGDSYIGGHTIEHGSARVGLDKPTFGKPVWKSGFMTGKVRYKKPKPKSALMERMDEIEKEFKREKRRGRRGKTLITGVILSDLSGGRRLKVKPLATKRVATMKKSRKRKAT